jgi:hypothetical protein
MKTKMYLEKKDCFTYPNSDAYYSPNVLYPEYPFLPDTLSDVPNEIYEMVRNTLFGLGLDTAHFGSKEWNPLGEYVKPDCRILIKPNWVTHRNTIGGLDCTVTHPSIIRVLIDYCIIAKAAIIEIGDSPIQESNLTQLLDEHGYNRLFGFILDRGGGQTYYQRFSSNGF